METKHGFHLMEMVEFADWLNACQVNRVIQLIQNHHTYLPDYNHFNGRNHFDRLLSMKNYHMVNNGWSNIAQTFTTFPDGRIAVCRPLNEVPVGIKGHNSKAICIEHFGNFDAGKDVMSPEHAETIIQLNALLCLRFSLEANTSHIVYHHWFDLNNGLRLNGKGVTKSCPGTAFFGGNKVEDAEAGFIPLIKARIDALRGTSTGNTDISVQKIYKQGIVLAPSLNVRRGPGLGFAVSASLTAGSVVNIFEEQSGWYKISGGNDWVSGRYIAIVRKARVEASRLNIRSGPSGSFSSLGSLHRNDEVLVYESLGDWSRIDINEKWVASRFLRFD